MTTGPPPPSIQASGEIVHDRSATMGWSCKLAALVRANRRRLTAVQTPDKINEPGGTRHAPKAHAKRRSMPGGRRRSALLCIRAARQDNATSSGAGPLGADGANRLQMIPARGGRPLGSRNSPAGPGTGREVRGTSKHPLSFRESAAFNQLKAEPLPDTGAAPGPASGQGQVHCLQTARHLHT